jgi:hypothetical protein
LTGDEPDPPPGIAEVVDLLSDFGEKDSFADIVIELGFERAREAVTDFGGNGSEKELGLLHAVDFKEGLMFLPELFDGLRFRNTVDGDVRRSFQSVGQGVIPREPYFSVGLLGEEGVKGESDFALGDESDDSMGGMLRVLKEAVVGFVKVRGQIAVVDFFESELLEFAGDLPKRRKFGDRGGCIPELAFVGDAEFAENDEDFGQGDENPGEENEDSPRDFSGDEIDPDSTPEPKGDESPFAGFGGVLAEKSESKERQGEAD